MRQISRSPLDILGITLGTIVILVVLGSVIGLFRGRMTWIGGDFRDRGWWGSFPTFSVGGALKAEEDEQIPAGSYAAVEVRSIAGSIDISGSSTAAVTAHATRMAASQAALDRVHVDVRTAGDRLILEERHDPGFYANAGTVAFRIAVPSGVKVLEAHSVSGDVDVTGLSGDVDQTLSTISGSVETDNAHNLEISSTSGHVGFTSTGSSLNAHTVSGSIDGTINALPAGGDVRANSISGSVNLDAFAGLDATVSLHSVSGSVSCDFPVVIQEQKRTSLRGKVGNGSASVDAGTVSGSISINKK